MIKRIDRVRAAIQGDLGAPPVAQPDRKALADAKVRELWESTFSTNNPFCPVDLKSFTKAVRATEHAHRVGLSAHPVQEPAGDAGALDREVSEWFAENARAALATPSAPAVPSGREVLKNTFALCEWFEDLPDGAMDSQEEERFKAGQRFAAKRIRNGIGTWFQDAAAPSAQPTPTGGEQ